MESFAVMVAVLGWRVCGPLDQNVACEVCATKKNGEHRTHGVDGLFEFDCPFTGRPRLIVVDGKSYQMASVGGKAKLIEWLKDLAKTVNHLNASRQTLKVDRGVPLDTPLDTGLLAWDCPDWNETKGRGWLKAAGESVLRRDAALLMIATPDVLTRMATTAEFMRSRRDVQFAFHREGTRLQWVTTVPPEACFGGFLLTRWTAKGKTRYGALHFAGEPSASEARAIISRFVTANPSLKKRRVWSMLPAASAARLSEYLKAESVHFGVSPDAISAKHLRPTLFQSR